MLALTFVAANASRILLPKNLASACGIQLYLRLDVTRDLLVVATLAAGLLLLAAGWKRRSLHAMLLLAVGFSLAASFIAVRVIEDGFRYRTGCGDGDGRSGSTVSPVAVAGMTLMALLHAPFRCVAVSKE